MNLKNYTSSVPVLDSISKIEFQLAKAGATHIAKSYENQKPNGMIFQIPVNNVPMTFKLPAKEDKVFQYMLKQRKAPPKGSALETLRLQAGRTAWKILSDWVDIQVSMIEISHIEVIEAFLQYLYDIKKDKTLYELQRDSGFKLLERE
jgi:hypothetical protein